MGAHFWETVEDTVTGKPVNGATVTVLTAPSTLGGVAVDVYSDEGLTTAIADSIVTTDSTGFFEFWTLETSVTIEIAYGGSIKRTITDVDLIGGAVSSDVTALQVRMDAVENVTEDAMVISLAALSDPGADRIVFWDTSASGLSFLTAGSGLSISGTTITVDALAGSGLADPNADRIRFWDDSAGAEAWLAPSSGLTISGTSIAVDGALDTTIWTGTSTVTYITPDALFDSAKFQTLTDGASITPNFGAGLNFKVTLGGNRTLENPTNAKDGQSGVIRVIQDGTGSRTLAFGSNWRWAGGSKTISTAANAIDMIAYVVGEDGLIYASLNKAFAA